MLRKLIIPACRESSRLASGSRTTALKRCGCAIHLCPPKKHLISHFLNLVRSGYLLRNFLHRLIITANRKSNRLRRIAEPVSASLQRVRLPPLPARKNALRLKCIFSWWAEVDSNHRRQSRQIYSLLPLAARESARILYSLIGGAGDRNRTNNLLITNQLLCQLSYTSKLPFRVVPRGGIEPPTRGFSVPCSTD